MDIDPRAATGAHSHRRYWTIYRDPEPQPRRPDWVRAVIWCVVLLADALAWVAILGTLGVIWHLLTGLP